MGESYIDFDLDECIEDEIFDIELRTSIIDYINGSISNITEFLDNVIKEEVENTYGLELI